MLARAGIRCAGPPSALYGAVRFAGGERTTVGEVAILFENAAAADSYARGEGWDDYLVSPLTLHIPEVPHVRWMA